MGTEPQEHIDRQVDLRARLAALPLTELKQAVEEAIREHRRLLEAEQTVYDTWQQACDDPLTPSSVKAALEEECLERRRRAFAQQDELSAMIDLLGYVPNVDAFSAGSDQ